MKAHISFRMRSLVPVLAGLAVTQIIATLFVWHSNADLMKSMEAVRATGWLAIPAGPAAAKLATFGAALRGGLFYTLSIGTGLTLATWALLYLWQKLLRGYTCLLLVPAGIVAVLLVAINLNGFILFPSLFVLCTPLATALAGLCRTADAAASRGHKLWPVPLLTLILLTGLWATQLNQQLFIAIRDHLLLSNAFGNTVNDFYYRNTLYAAQAFKSFGQKTIRTCRIEKSPDQRTTRKAIALLARHDVLTTPDNPKPDLGVTLADGQVTLRSARNDTLQISQQRFFTNPRKVLGQFSADTDRYGVFRKITFVGLLLGFPVLLYIFVDGVINRLGGIFIRGPGLIWLRAGLCLLIGVLLFVPMVAARPEQIAKDDIQAALTANQWPTRVAALRRIEADKLDIAAYTGYRDLIGSPLVVERYYAARALAWSHDPATYAELLGLIKDAHPNVVCQAYYALGVRKQRKAVAPIKAQMLQSDHWYTQWYGYRAIRRLGWHQTTAKSIYKP